jgi:hypothetical protein
MRALFWPPNLAARATAYQNEKTGTLPITQAPGTDRHFSNFCKNSRDNLGSGFPFHSKLALMTEPASACPPAPSQDYDGLPCHEKRSKNQLVVPRKPLRKIDIKIVAPIIGVASGQARERALPAIQDQDQYLHKHDAG